MKMIILVIPLLITLHSEGQIINASQPYRPQVASCSYLLDQYSGAAAAYSLRKLDCDYTGYAIRVRRSSDNSEQDIGFTSNGDLDTAALKTFVSTNSGYVVTWYDQSGNGRHGAQTTTTRQPKIISGGIVVREGSKPSIYYEGPDRYFTVTLESNLSQPNSFFIVGKINGDNNRHFIDGIGISPANRNVVGVNGGYVIYAGNVLTYGSSLTTFCLYTAIFDGTSSKIQRNGISPVTGNAGTQDLASFNIGKGAGVDYANGIIGYISEIIIYNSNQNSNLSSIESVINSYYSIY